MVNRIVSTIYRTVNILAALALLFCFSVMLTFSYWVFIDNSKAPTELDLISYSTKVEQGGNF